MNAKIECRKQCGHKPFKSVAAERMHFHRIHSGRIVAFKQKHQADSEIPLTPKTGKPDKRSKEWRAAHPRQAKLINGRPKGDAVERIMERFASPSPVKLDCPNCHFDFGTIHGNTVPAQFCPGCGVPIQTFVNRLAAFLKP